MKFSIGYNYDANTLSLLETYKDYLEAFYFPMPRQYLGSGRNIMEPKSYEKQIPNIIKKCRSLNILPQLLLNATCEGKLGLSNIFFMAMLNYIKKLRDMGLGSVVVTNPIYIRKIKKEVSDIKVESSVNCYVKTVEHAQYLKDLGVDVLTIDRDINRNIPLIKEIKNKTSLTIRIMLNEGCLNNCPYRITHYNYLSHGPISYRKAIKGIFFAKFCVEIYLKNPLKVFRIPFIPPDALGYYKQFIDYYKLSTRTFPTDQIESCLKTYISGHFSGNLLTILDSPGLSYFEYIDYNTLKKSNFFEKMLNCNLKCKDCGYCKVLFKNAVLINRGDLYKRNSEEERRAIKIYKKILEDSANNYNKAQIYIRIGEAYFKLYKYKEAIKNLKKAIELNRKGRKIYSILGFCYEKLGNFKRAIKALLKAKKNNPKNRNVNFALCRCYKSIGNTKLFDKEINMILRKLDLKSLLNSLDR